MQFEYPFIKPVFNSSTRETVKTYFYSNKQVLFVTLILLYVIFFGFYDAIVKSMCKLGWFWTPVARVYQMLRSPRALRGSGQVKKSSE